MGCEVVPNVQKGDSSEAAPGDTEAIVDGRDGLDCEVGPAATTDAPMNLPRASAVAGDNDKAVPIGMEAVKVHVEQQTNPMHFELTLLEDGWTKR
ncbi:hypothetical protein OIU84_022855 [Salix udensis]|uniref:Uncharacterized protein n=1 Tax=Salix udensis TaxID=889485 RepID=A0AAD6KPY2_9ROSI|nr:hypothetical protein OIU84_022855 [Salix udensis]